MPGLRGRKSEGFGRMRLLFDQNLSRKLVGLLAAEYPNSLHVESAGLLNADDLIVWHYAAREGLVVVSKDSDFQEMAVWKGPPPQVIWLNVGNGPTALVASLLRGRLADVEAFCADPTAALLILP